MVILHTTEDVVDIIYSTHVYKDGDKYILGLKRARTLPLLDIYPYFMTRTPIMVN